MEQKISDDRSNTSPLSKIPKLQQKGNIPPSDTTSNNAATIAENLNAPNVVCDQERSIIVTAEHQKQSKTVYLIFFSLRRKNLSGVLQRIFNQTPPV